MTGIQERFTLVVLQAVLPSLSCSFKVVPSAASVAKPKALGEAKRLPHADHFYIFESVLVPSCSAPQLPVISIVLLDTFKGCRLGESQSVILIL
ncbi:MAG: hypothetical protein JOZ78_16985 [Chroococcidiopsidaceae cyanobacterium CP_BM_ER_R8_30]|nr:hypothetical protein [Chroococcidiopsidaceae cyanobacterium CP_BM_ER_R8_30]